MTDLRIGFSRLIRRFSYVKKIESQRRPLFYYMPWILYGDNTDSHHDPCMDIHIHR